MKTEKGVIRIAALLLALALTAASPALAAKSGGGKSVRLGYYSEAGMMNGAEEGAVKSGYVYEYVMELASRAGWKYDYVYGSFAELYQMLLRGEIDALPYISWSEERSRELLFPEEKMGDEQFYVASLKDETFSDDLRELRGKRVGTTRDAFQNIPFRAFLEEKGISCELVEYDLQDYKWVGLQEGEVDYTIETSTIIQPITLHVVTEFGERYPFYLVVSPDREDLLTELNAAQQAIDDVDPGFLDDLRLRYFKSVPLFKEIPADGEKWLANRDTIVIGSYTDSEPYTIENKDGSVTGIAPAQVELMLSELGVSVNTEWKLYSSRETLLSALYAGDVDCVTPYFRSCSDAEADGLILSRTIFETDFSVLYEGKYAEDTLSVVACSTAGPGPGYVRDNYPDAVVIACRDGSECLTKLKTGEATSIVMHTDALQRLVTAGRGNYKMKALEARCETCFAALPENVGLISVFNKAASFLTDVERGAIENRYSIEEGGVSIVSFLRARPEYFWGAIAILLILCQGTILALYRRKKVMSEREKEAAFYKDITDRFTSSYEAVFVGDLNSGLCRVVANKNGVGRFKIGTEVTVEAIVQYFRDAVHPYDYQKMRKSMISFGEIRSRLPVGGSDTMEYRKLTIEGYVWCRATLSRVTENEVMIGLKNSDREIVNEIVNKKLADEFDALYLLDLERDELRAVRGSKISEVGGFTGTLSYRETVRRFAETVPAQYRQDWLNFSDVTFLRNYLAGEDHREYVYELPAGEKTMRRFCVDVIERVNGDAVTALCSFVGIDDMRARAILLDRELVKQKVLLDYLVSSYSSAYYVDLEGESFEILHMEQESRKAFGSFGEGREGMERFIEARVHPDDRELTRRVVGKAYVKERLKAEPSFSFTVRELFGETEKTMRGVVIRGADDAHVAVGFMDVTAELAREREQQRKLEEALDMAKSANRAKTTFLNNVSHDIRTPMNTIIGYTHLAASHADEPDRVREYVEKIGRSSSHLLGLINDVLDMSRIESGKVTLREKPERLSGIVHALEDILQSDVQAKKHEFTVDDSGVRDDVVICDRLRLNQVLLNLLSNSVKYTPSGGRVSLRVCEEPAENGSAVYRFHVCDNGIGMDEKFLKEIFEPFTRASTSTVSGVQGTGLGMAITGNIVALMGGTIKIESEPGKGTETIVSLPFRISEEACEEDAAEETRRDYSGRKLLLVEDNEMNREIATELLTEAGFTVDTAENGELALNALRDGGTGRYDAILMDVQMPVMNGYEATKAIRALPGGGEIPIIALSANAFEEDRQRSLEAGMNAHVAKPIDVKILFAVLDSLIR